MQADVVAAPLPVPVTLTRRASLNAVQSLLDYAARLAVGLAVTPLLVGRLGREMFGVWEMLNRLIGYMSAADGRPTEALRLVIATKQGAVDPLEHGAPWAGRSSCGCCSCRSSPGSARSWCGCRRP